MTVSPGIPQPSRARVARSARCWSHRRGRSHRRCSRRRHGRRPPAGERVGAADLLLRLVCRRTLVWRDRAERVEQRADGRRRRNRARPVRGQGLRRSAAAAGTARPGRCSTRSRMWRFARTGAFSLSERQAGQRRPFKPARELTVLRDDSRATRFAERCAHARRRRSTAVPRTSRSPRDEVCIDLPRERRRARSSMAVGVLCDSLRDGVRRFGCFDHRPAPSSPAGSISRASSIARSGVGDITIDTSEAVRRSYGSRASCPGSAVTAGTAA